MVEIDRAVYRDGRRHECGDLSDTLAQLREAGEGFLWIGLLDPTLAEFEDVQEELALHPLAVEDAITGNQRTKVETYDGSLFVSLRTLRYLERTSDVETGELMMFVGEQFVVTVRRGQGTPLKAIREEFGRNAELMDAGPVGVLYAVADMVADQWLAVDAELGQDLEEIEAAVFAGDEGVSANTIYRLKREVLEARRAVTPVIAPLRRLVSGELSIVREDQVAFFRDILDHAAQVAEHIDTYDRLLSDILSAHLAQVSVQQNDDMRRISAWVAIFAVPTYLAGVYGMNFDNMPELHWRYGYFVLLGVMAAVMVGLYVAFKRSRWL